MRTHEEGEQRQVNRYSSSNTARGEGVDNTDSQGLKNGWYSTPEIEEGREARNDCTAALLNGTILDVVAAQEWCVVARAMATAIGQRQGPSAKRSILTTPMLVGPRSKKKGEKQRFPLRSGVQSTSGAFRLQPLRRCSEPNYNNNKKTLTPTWMTMAGKPEIEKRRTESKSAHNLTKQKNTRTKKKRPPRPPSANHK